MQTFHSVAWIPENQTSGASLQHHGTEGQHVRLNHFNEVLIWCVGNYTWWLSCQELDEIIDTTEYQDWNPCVPKITKNWTGRQERSLLCNKRWIYLQLQHLVCYTVTSITETEMHPQGLSLSGFYNTNITASGGPLLMGYQPGRQLSPIESEDSCIR